MPSLKLMTWNVLYSEKADNILKLIAKVKPDIICCQEITTNSHINRDRNVPEELGHLLNGQYVYQEVLTAMENHPGSLGNAIISKFPIISSRQAFIQRGDSDIDYSKQNRGYVEARIQLDNQRVITIGTTHLSYTSRFVITPDRNNEAAKLYHEISNNTDNFMITGDFNAAPDSSIIQEMEKMFVSAGPAYNQNTFTTKPFNHDGFIVNNLEWRLDYIFASKDIKIVNCKIISTDFSDHLPIVATIDI